MSVVLDSSITLSWYFEDERTEASHAVLQLVAEEGAVVPPLWRFEVANGLQMAVRRKRIDAAFRDASLEDLMKLEVATDPDSDAHTWSASVQIADLHHLTVYDAAYLELAQRRRMRLATLDAALIKAGGIAMVPVIGS